MTALLAVSVHPALWHCAVCGTAGGQIAANVHVEKKDGCGGAVQTRVASYKMPAPKKLGWCVCDGKLC